MRSVPWVFSLHRSLLPALLLLPPFPHDRRWLRDNEPPVQLRQRDLRHPGRFLPLHRLWAQRHGALLATELNDSVPSNFTDFQDSLVHFAHYMDDDALGKLLAEAHRDYADYRRAEGVSASPSSVSVMVDRTGELVEEMIAEERLCWMSSEKRLSQSIARKFLITNSLQLKQNKNAEFYRENHCGNNRIFVKFINKIL